MDQVKEGVITMTARQLISLYRQHQPDGHFFDKDTLRFFGEKISEMKVQKELAIIQDVFGKGHTCYVLTAMQHNYPDPDYIATGIHYFDSTTFDDIAAGYTTKRREKNHEH